MENNLFPTPSGENKEERKTEYPWQQYTSPHYSGPEKEEPLKTERPLDAEQPAVGEQQNRPTPEIPGAPYHQQGTLPPTPPHQQNAMPPYAHAQQPHPGAYQQPPYRQAAPVMLANQPKKKPKRNWGRKALSTVALLVACTFCGFGGAYIALQNADLGTADNSITQNNNTDGQASGLAGNQSVSDIAEKASASVVSITTENTVQTPFGTNQEASGAGSGVVISEDGTIITNNHVVAGASNIKVTLPDGTEYDAELVGADSISDIAVLKINATGLTPATIGNSEDLRVGDFCLAIGNPLGTLEGTVTDGIISAKDRQIAIEGRTMNLLQMSAAVSPGNSGGGLFNTNGELIGIVNAKSGDGNSEGLGFAIPVNDAMEVANQLQENGYVTGRPAMGVVVRTLVSEQEAQMAGVDKPGVYLQDVTDGGAADRAGLQVGDRLARVDGEEVEEFADLEAVMAGKKVGDTLALQVERNGEMMDFEVELQEMQTEATLPTSG